MSASARVTAATSLGLKRTLVGVEIAIPGSGTRPTSLREMLSRVDAAVSSSGYENPDGGYTLNLPSDLPAAGVGHLDLAVAVALLAASGQMPATRTAGWMLIGELSLGGELRPVRGAILSAAAGSGSTSGPNCRKMHAANRRVVSAAPGSPSTARARRTVCASSSGGRALFTEYCACGLAVR
jgi:predicted ATPase with chaperone activity